MMRTNALGGRNFTGLQFSIFKVLVISQKAFTRYEDLRIYHYSRWEMRKVVILKTFLMFLKALTKHIYKHFLDIEKKNKKHSTLFCRICLKISVNSMVWSKNIDWTIWQSDSLEKSTSASTWFPYIHNTLPHFATKHY